MKLLLAILFPFMFLSAGRIFQFQLYVNASTSPSADLITHCPSTSYTPNFLTGQTNLSIPAGEVARYVSIGRGIQNYTCTNSTWTSIGALARLYDVSCIDPTLYPKLSSITLVLPVHNLGSPPRRRPRVALESSHEKQEERRRTKPDHGASTCRDASLEVLHDLYTGTTSPHSSYLGYHSFVSLNGTLVPSFDFTSTQGPGQYVLVKRVGSIPSPDDTKKNVAWLQLNAFKGGLAKTLFRIETRGGVPPSSCNKEGEELQVQYSAIYAFFA
ncbi:hypothetical protein MNV49_005829 [Pseudohyphozyma bogoriensis]|nr:hypothetical protein MNV49_005829 [Pseudohyphozyma bogoriensis]